MVTSVNDPVLAELNPILTPSINPPVMVTLLDTKLPLRLLAVTLPPTLRLVPLILPAVNVP